MDVAAELCLTMRESLDPDAKHVTLSVNNHSISIKHRSETGGETEERLFVRHPERQRYLRLIRKGSRVLLESSTDRVTWQRLEEGPLVGEVNVSMAEELCVGYGIASHDEFVPVTGVLRDIRLIGNSPEPPEYLPFLLTDRVVADPDGQRWAWRDVSQEWGTWTLGGNNNERVSFFISDQDNQSALLPLPENILQQAWWQQVTVDLDAIRQEGVDTRRISALGLRFDEREPFHGGPSTLRIDNLQTGLVFPELSSDKQSDPIGLVPGFSVYSYGLEQTVSGFESFRELADDESRLDSQTLWGQREVTVLDFSEGSQDGRFPGGQVFPGVPLTRSQGLFVRSMGTIELNSGVQNLGVDTNALYLTVHLDDHLLIQRIERTNEESLVRASVKVKEGGLFGVKLFAYFPPEVVALMELLHGPADGPEKLVGER